MWILYLLMRLKEKICSAIHELRAKDDGKRNNSVILQHVHDFYANTH